MTRKRHPVHFNDKNEPSRKLRHKLPASARRSKLRKLARDKFAYAIKREREIGIDPIFLHGPKRDDGERRKAWIAKSKGYAWPAV